MAVVRDGELPTRAGNRFSLRMNAARPADRDLVVTPLALRAAPQEDAVGFRYDRTVDEERLTPCVAIK